MCCGFAASASYLFSSQTDTFYAKSIMTKGPSSLAALQSWAAYLYSSTSRSNTGWFIGFDCKSFGSRSRICYLPSTVYGGAIGQVAKDATAFENRDAFITYQFYLSSGTSAFPSTGISFITNMSNALEPNPTAACKPIFL
jgi:hypothetical protein